MSHPTREALRAAVRRDLDREIWSIPLTPGKKRPRAKGWRDLRIRAPDIDAHFEAGVNRGRLLGALPDSPFPPLVVVDLDVPEACKLAPHLLPPTGELGGRASRPRAHWAYRCSAPPPTARFSDTDGKRILELLSTGCQVVVPPSIHPSGEPYQWFEDGTPSTVSATALIDACVWLATATLAARAGVSPGQTLAPLLGPVPAARVTAALAAERFGGPPADDAVRDRMAEWAGRWVSPTLPP